MEKLVTVADVKERYGCSRQTARKYLRECNPHMEKPLTAPEWAFHEWERNRVVEAYEKTHIAMESVRQMERTLVPRRR